MKRSEEFREMAEKVFELYESSIMVGDSKAEMLAKDAIRYLSALELHFDTIEKEGLMNVLS